MISQGCHQCPVDPRVQEESECFLQLVFGQEHLGGQKSLCAGGVGVVKMSGKCQGGSQGWSLEAFLFAS